MESKIPTLTIRLTGYGWKARINVHVMMVDRGIADVRDFVKLYLQHMPQSDANREAMRQIMDWFPAAIDAATADWKKASQEYVNGYRLPVEYPTRPNKKQVAERRKREAENKKLLKAVEVAKKTLNRIEKRKAVFLEECAARKIPLEFE